MTYEKLLEFVRLNEGNNFTTITHNRAFTCTVASDAVRGDAILIQRLTGKRSPKRATKRRIEFFCERYNQLGSDVVTDYHPDLTAAAPQLLALTNAIKTHGMVRIQQ